MASEGGELDLYADDIGDEFSQENEFNDNDLYDDVLTSNANQRNTGGSDEQQFNGNSSNNSAMNSGSQNSGEPSLSLHSNKKPCLYIGNLTWWTTDEDVIKACASIGINDIIDVKFFENRANGQSKGFCVVSMQSDNSVRQTIEKLPKCAIHSQNPMVTLCTKQNLNIFEMKSRKPGQNGQFQNQNNQQNNRTNNQGGGVNPSNNMMNRPPLIQRPLRPSGPLLNSQPRLTLSMPHQNLSFNNPNAHQWNQHGMMGNSNSRNNSMQSGANSLNPMLRLNQGNRQLSNQPLLSAPANQTDLRTKLSSVAGLTGVAGQHPMSSSHPALFSGQAGGLVGATNDPFVSSRLPPQLNPYAAAAAAHQMSDFSRSALDSMVSLGSGMSDAEFDELLSKNKTLANNSIQKAVNDASSGEYPSAVETLNVAISLIKGSRIGHDERCKIIISSLQDTLQGIESKFYAIGGDRRKERPRSRSRERGSSRREKDRRRDRSRSPREREYRERSRDRYHDDHHEDRYREKDRYHDRDRRRH